MTKSELLVTGPNGEDEYYVGPLAEAQAAVKKDRSVHEYRVGNKFHVDLCDDTTPHEPHIAEDSPFDMCDWTAEWGSGSTNEEAWRYALAALLGPADDEYQGDEALLAWLNGTEA